MPKDFGNITNAPMIPMRIAPQPKNRRKPIVLDKFTLFVGFSARPIA
jgi:hypothetical protein